MGVKSREDIEIQKKKFENNGKCASLISRNDWSLIKRKEVKSQLLESYMIERGKQEGWNNSKIKKILSTLLLALQIKKIPAESVIIENGRVIDIKDFEVVLNGIASWFSN